MGAANNEDVNPELEKGKEKFAGLGRGEDCLLSLSGLLFLTPRPLR
jgi:hypothetical protein